MTNLTGKALQDEAKRLDIKGRSKMTADELRTAVSNAQAAQQQTNKVVDTITNALASALDSSLDQWHTVPNRADRRRTARHFRSRAKNTACSRDKFAQSLYGPNWGSVIKRANASNH